MCTLEIHKNKAENKAENKAKIKAAAAGECVDFLYFTRSEIRSDIICVLLVSESVIYLFCISVYLFV